MFRVLVILGISACVSLAQENAEPVYQTDFSTASVSPVNAPIAGGGELQSGFSVSEYSSGPGITRMRLVPRGEEVPPESDSASWADLAFISEVAGTNPAALPEEAVERDAYIEFSLLSEKPVNFIRIEFSMVGVGSKKSGGVILRSSADDFAADLGSIEGPLNGIYQTSVDLEGRAAFKNLRAVTFRFYFYDSFEGRNNRLIGIDDVSVWAVPINAAASQ